MLDFVVVWLACFALYSHVAGSLIYVTGSGKTLRPVKIKKNFVMVKFIIYGPLALYCANFKAIAFMTPEEQLLERSR